MSVNTGRIGGQESVSMIGSALVVGAVFTLDSGFAFSGGNSSYIWLPLSVGVSYGIFLLTTLAMQRTGARDIFEFLRRSFGKLLGTILIYLFALLLLYSAYAPLANFAGVIHTYVFVEAVGANIVIWMLAALILPCFLGMECIARTTKCFALLLGVLLIVGFVTPAREFERFRLYPLLGDGVYATAQKGYMSVYRSLPAFIAALGMTRGMQGLKNVRRYGLIAACIAAGICALVMLALGLCYTYKELSGMFAPLYRINMILSGESYFFRLDKISSFLWLIGGLLVSAYYVYAAALFITEGAGLKDTRPAALTGCGLVAAMLLLSSSLAHESIDAVYSALQSCGTLCAAAPLLAASLISVFKPRQKETSDEKA